MRRLLHGGKGVDLKLKTLLERRIGVLDLSLKPVFMELMPPRIGRLCRAYRAYLMQKFMYAIFWIPFLMVKRYQKKYTLGKGYVQLHLCFLLLNFFSTNFLKVYQSMTLSVQKGYKDGTNVCSLPEFNEIRM